MRHLPLAAALALLAGCGPQPAASIVIGNATATVDSLYRVRQPFQTRGAPTAAELATMRPWLSAELAGLLVRADSLRSAGIAKAPDEKPAFAEGDLFTSLFEGPLSFAIETEKADSTGSGAWRVPVRFTTSDSANTITWTDTAIVISENGRAVVSDVRYGGEWDFANKGSLLNSLAFSFVPGTP